MEARRSVGPQITSSGETTLDLIKYQDSTNFITSLAKRLQELGGSNVDAAFTLYGLNNDSWGVFVDQLLHGCDVVIFSITEAGQHRAKRRLIFLVWCR